MGKIAGVHEVPLDKLRPYPNNAKKHGSEQIERIKASISEFGFLTPCLIDADFNLIAGHGRLEAAKQLGMKKVPCVSIEGLTEAQRKAYILADNRLGELGEWDMELVTDELIALDEMDFDIDLTGFELPSEEEQEPQEVVEDDFGEEVETRCKLGDVWQLGEHRLICGDSTDTSVIDRLMDGVKAQLLLTDPPYGTTGVEWDCKIDLEKMWAVVNAKIESNSACVLFSAQPFTTDLIISNRNKYRYEIIWEKTQPTGFYSANKAPLRLHENIEVFYSSLPVYNPQKHDADEEKQKGKGRTRHKKADRCVLYGHVKAQDYTDDGTRYPTDVIHFSNWNRAGFVETGDKTVHPTQKPVEILGYLIKTYSNENDSILDLFGGSGSTLIACEQLNRKCYMVELDPHYCDVIINRWETFTGREAVLLNG